MEEPTRYKTIRKVDAYRTDKELTNGFRPTMADYG